MNMEKFSLRGPEQMVQPQIPEEFDIDEHQTELTPTSIPASEIEQMEPVPEQETEQVVEQQVEQKEEKETFEARYERLANEAWEIREEGRATYGMGSMQRLGLQTLISEFGAKKFFDAAVRSWNDGGFSAFEIIQALEPDKTKRNVLYEKMLTDATQKAAEYEKDFNEQWMGKKDEFQAKYAYFETMHGSDGKARSLLFNTELNIRSFKNLDSFLGKFVHYKIATMVESDTSFLRDTVHKYMDDEVKLIQEFELAGNDTYQLVEQRDKANIARTEKLRAELDQLADQLSIEIQRITTESNLKLEEFRARVIDDLSKVANLETASEEMSAALQETLSKVEEQIAVQVQATEKEIAEKTAPLLQTIKSTATLRNPWSL